MMANRVECDYGTLGATREQVKQFVWHTAQQAAVAIVVNALFMYLLGEEEGIYAGLINGGVTALSINTVHKFSHIVWKEKPNEATKVKFIRLCCLAIVNYLAVSYFSSYLGYDLTRQKIFEQMAFSYVGILGMAYYLNAQTHKNRRDNKSANHP